jgi:hypothetical protein
MNRLTTFPVATFCLAIAFLIVVGIGGVLAIQHEISYLDYAKTVGVVAVALGLLGIGRGRDSESKP